MAREEAENLVEELHLHSYREFSALTRDGLADSMDHAVCLKLLLLKVYLIKLPDNKTLGSVTRQKQSMKKGLVTFNYTYFSLILCVHNYLFYL